MTVRENTIPHAKLGRIVQDVRRASSKSSEHPEFYVSRFGNDHGSLTVWDMAGKQQLVFSADGDILRGNVSRALWQLSPAITEELVRGYKLARAAGLLGDGKINLELAKFLSPLSIGFTDEQQLVAGAAIADGMRNVLRKENHKPGGVPIIEDGS